MRSIPQIVPSVSFCTLSAACLCASSPMSPSFSSLLEHVHAVAANMAHGDARLLGIFVGDLDEVLAAVGVEVGDRDAQQGSLDDRIEAEVGLANGAVDGPDVGLVPYLNRQHARLGHTDRRDLVDRHRRAIDSDMNRIEQARRRAAGAQPAQLALQNRYRAVHAARDVSQVHSFLPKPR